MSDLDVDILQRAWRKFDVAAGSQAAALVPLDAIEMVAGRRLAEDGDRWDLLPEFFGVTTTDVWMRAAGQDGDAAVSALTGVAVDALRPREREELARLLSAGTSVDADGTAVTAVATVPLGQVDVDGQTPDRWLMGRSVPDWCGAAFVVTEGWRTLSAADRAELGERAAVDDRGMAEFRSVTVVTRTGDEAHLLHWRGAEDVSVSRVAAADVAAPSSCTSCHYHVDEASHVDEWMADHLRRALGLAARVPTTTPWVAMIDQWAQVASSMLEEIDWSDDEAVMILLDVRPDRRELRLAAEPDVAATAELAGISRSMADQPCPAVPDLYLAEWEPRVWRALAGAGWGPVARWVATVSEHPDGPTSAQLEWMGPRLAFTVGVAADTPRGAADRLARDHRPPMWFRSSVRRAVAAARTLEVPGQDA